MTTTTRPDSGATFEVGPAFVLPELDDLPGVGGVDEPSTIELDSLYYDAPDLRLTRSSIELTRRTGVDEGWRLTIPAGDGPAEEISRPLASPRAVPPELKDLVTARLRGAPLAPVAHVRNQRTVRVVRDADGAAVATIADERIDARRTGRATYGEQWREVEVTGQANWLDRIGVRLAESGARPRGRSELGWLLREELGAGPSVATDRRRGSGQEPVFDYLRVQAAALSAADPAVRRELPDSVHKMRVASRRLRSTLRTFRPGERTAADHLNEELRWLAALLGAVRDREVQLARLSAAVEEQPPELLLGPVAARITGRLRPELAQARVELLAGLRSPRYRALLGQLDDFLEAGSVRPPDRSSLRRRTRKALRSLDRRLAAAQVAPAGPDQDHAMHQSRKGAKRLRYAAETLAAPGGVRPRRAATLAKRAERIQELLGDHQDSVVARGLLRELGLAAQATPGESSFSFGLLVGAEQCRGTTARAKVARQQRKLARKRYRRWLG